MGNTDKSKSIFAQSVKYTFRGRLNRVMTICGEERFMLHEKPHKYEDVFEWKVHCRGFYVICTYAFLRKLARLLHK